MALPTRLNVAHSLEPFLVPSFQETVTVGSLRSQHPVLTRHQDLGGEVQGASIWFFQERDDPCLCSTATKPDTAPSHSRALSPRKRVREGVAPMSSSLSLTMSVSGPQNRRLFCGTCRRWGRRGSQVTPGLGHVKTSCSGSPGMGKRFSVFRKGKHCRANYGHILPPPSWCHFSYKLFLQATGLRRDAKDQ